MNHGRLLFLLPFFVLAVSVLPVSEAQRSAQGPKGPTREPAPAARRSAPPSMKSNAPLAITKAPTGAKPLALKPSAAPQDGGPEPISSRAVNFAESAPLRDVAAHSTAVEDDRESADAEEAAENRAVRRPTSSALAAAKRMSLSQALMRDSALQTLLSPMSIASPIATFEGLSLQDNAAAGFGALSPPDTNGYVGRDNYVQQTNLLVRVWDKSGNPLTAPFRLSSLFAPLGGQCAAPDQGDPIVLYDPLADRWILSQFAFTGLTTPPYHECIAVSKNGDPTGSYYLYDFVTVGNEFPDYPKLGVWPDGYYMMVHQFTLGGPFNGTGAYSFNRAKMLVGDPTANFIYFNLSLASHPEGIGGSLPSDFDGLTPPPAGRPNTFAYFTTTDFGEPANGLRLFDFHSDFNFPANSTFTERAESTYNVPLAVAPFSIITPTGNQGRRAVPQPAPANTVTTALDAITDRLMHRMQYRNFGGGVETLVVSHNVGAPASTVFGTFRAAPRYYELRNTGSGFFVQEQATYAPADGVSRWMSSAAEDNQGNLAVGFSVSSGAAGGNVFPGIRYAGRLFGDPPGGLFQGENTLINGTGAQRSTGNRWGDYSALTVDPTDDCTFWYTQEYYTAAGQAASAVGWQTRIGNFKFDQCTAPQMGTLKGKVTFCETGAPTTGAIVQASDGHSGTTLADGTYSILLAPGDYSVEVTAAGQSCTTKSFNTTVTNGGTTTLDACLNGAPKPTVTSMAVSGGNGNGVIEINECNNLVLGLSNAGCAGATNVSAALSSGTPGVTVQQPNSPYPGLPIGGNGANTVPFEVSTAPDFVCGTTIDFTLTVTTDQGVFALNFTKPSCTAPAVNLSGSIAAGDTTMTGRIVRNGVASTCAAPKAYPGTQDAAAGRRYDSYSFTNTSNGTACVTVNVTSGCGTNIFYVAYLGSFNPANVSQNYLADAGASFAGVATFSFNLSSGQTFVLVIHEVTVGSGCANYTASIAGLLSDVDGGGECQSCQIDPQSDIVVSNDPGQCGAVVNYPAATFTGSCGVLTSVPQSGSFFPVGATTVTTTSTSGATSTFKVTVQDNEAPVVAPLAVAVASLEGTKHNMVNVGLSGGGFTDNCPGATREILVFGDEDDETDTGDGNFSPDATGIGIGTLQLRSERVGAGDGRVYLIVVKVTDAAGNVSVTCATVVVPKSNSKVDINSVNAQAAAAKEYALSHNGMAPPGYFVIGDAASNGPKP
jgi:Carboxypeptidase regulatory-like domain